MDEKVKRAKEFVRENLSRYNQIGIISSFGKDSMVTLDIIFSEITEDLPIIWVKPPFLPLPTLEFVKEVERLWDLDITIAENQIVYDKDWMRENVIQPGLWKHDPEKCCRLFKVEPMKKVIKQLELEAWFSGLRRTESEERKDYKRIRGEESFTMLHPILDFTEADVWRYTAVHDLPVQKLYGEGYRSLGCIYCSEPNTWESERSGRWSNTEMKGCGCGIHKI